MITKTLGWKPDLPDYRDYQLKSTIVAPETVDLRPLDTPIYGQGQLGSCTANAVAAHLDFNRKKQGEAPINPSRLFIYYNERVMQNTVASDSGATIRESVKEVKAQGACPESEWPYDIAKFKDAPPPAAYTDAIKYEALQYLRVKKTGIKQCLAEGYPLVFGFTVYNSFFHTGADGIMPFASGGVAGGHAVMAVGYTPNYLICRNSWGEAWGDKGYFYMPWGYVHSSLVSDLWTLRLVK